jgi:hypothetical protein
MVGLHVLLCNRCGLEFKGLQLFGTVERKPAYEIENPANRRRVPRYNVHLTASIHLAEKNEETGKISYSESSRGHCEAISKFGLALSLVGTRFVDSELMRVGRLLYVMLNLPTGPVDVVVSVVTHERSRGEAGAGKWLIGTSIVSISESDNAKLATYLERLATTEPVLFTE